jgi:triphosphoribosyl-dephospho-CoA synthase
MQPALGADLVCEAVRCACLGELQAMKPGNVSFYADGHGMTAGDFERSARAVAPLLSLPGLTVGERIYSAIDATRGVAGCNTNLGIVLLCAPLAHAALHVRPGQTLQATLVETLENLDEHDTALTYRAIRLARPGGMGVVQEHDISTKEPRASLLQVMAAAAHRDRIACQYAHAYADVFEFAEPHLRARLNRWRSEPWAVVSVYLALLAAFGDSLVERKHGLLVAHRLQLDAGYLGAQLDAQSEPAHMLERLSVFDRWLKRKGINPGTTADLVVAALLVKGLHDHMQTTGLAPVSGRETGSGCCFPPVLSLTT